MKTATPSKTKTVLPGTETLVEKLRQDLQNGKTIRHRDLLDKASLHLGSDLGHGQYDFRYLYDALEVALHQVIESRCETLRVLEPAHTLEYLNGLLTQLPTQRVRTIEQTLYQQFSAPAPLAFTANYLAFLNTNGSKPIAVEPSAGTGALACIARGFGATVITNDLSITRQAFLKLLGFEVHGVDAENLNDLLPQDITPDVITMNPPFSSTAGRLIKNDNKHGARHIQAGLYRLQENGRLVAITGEGMALNRQKMSPFWQQLASQYNIRMNVSLPPSTFVKNGTTWDTQLIVIDKNGPTPGRSWSDQVNNIRHGDSTLLEILTLARDGKLFIEPSPANEETLALSAVSDAPIDATETVVTTTPPQSEPENTTNEDNGFVSYVAQRLTGGIDHPAALVETASMAAVTSPPITYRPHLDPQLITSGALSNVQLERICYAGQRHAQRLPTGAIPAYVVGDGTGFGKGRCLAGIIIDNHNQGRTRTLWLSISNQLLESTRRDLRDLNALDIALHQLNEWEVNDNLDFGNGVIFCSYNTLIAKSKTTDKTRMEQLIEWLGEDGLVIFDECQRAQNALATAQGEATQTGTAVCELQDHELRPNLRFIYSSATSVVEVSHLCYMTRLGLWGEGTSFKTFGEFMSEIEGGGLGALEMVTRSMKANGMSHASTLSYGIDPLSGLAVEYEEVFHELTPQQREIYNNAAAAWQVVLQNIDTALGITNAGPRQAAFAKSHFWAQHQAFFRQVITAFKVPECINQIELALKRGESAIVSVIGTAEAKSKKLVAKATAEGGKLEDLDFSPRATLCALAERAFPVDLYEQKVDEVTQKIITVRVVDGEGNPVQSQVALRMRDELLEKLSDLVLPENPLDQIINYFGPDKVAEISGRRKRLIRNQTTGTVEYVSRAPKGVPMSRVNIYENEQFLDGDKRIAIITAAGSTGISLHASLNAKNQQRRCHIVLELAWSAVLQMQSFGRSHRSFQKYPPKYILLSTNLGGERRFSATIARRLASLGALCKGDRNAADGGTQLSRYSFESTLGTGTLALLYKRVFDGVKIPDLENPRDTLKDMGLVNKDGEVNDRDRYNVPRFLNRILSLDCDRQNAFFAYYANLFDECVSHAKASGTFDDGVQDIKAISIKIQGEPEVIYIDETTTAQTLHYTLAVETKSTRVSPEHVKAMFDEATVGGFYRNKNGAIFLATKSGNHTDPSNGNTYQTFAVTRPEEARSYYMTDADLRKHKKVHVKTALAWWSLYCQSIPETTVDEIHMIAGAVLPIWHKLKTSKDTQLRVARVMTEDNKRIVGVKIPSNRVQQILRALGIAKAISDPGAIIDVILNNDDSIPLVDNMSLERGRVYGTNYVEVRGVWSRHFEELRELGLLNMSIEYRQRFFLPTNKEDATEVLAKLLEKYPTDNPVEETETAPVQFTDLKAMAAVDTVNIHDLIIPPKVISTPKPLELSEPPMITIVPAPPPTPPIAFDPAAIPSQLNFWDAIGIAA